MKSFITLVLVLLLVSPVLGQTKKELKEKEKQEEYIKVKALIELGVYGFNPRSARGTKRTINLTGSSNSLIINKDKASASLPFFGKSQISGYSGSGNIEFQNENIEYDIEYDDDKKRIEISFIATNKSERFDITLIVSGNGNASLSVSSMSRDRMSYSGKVNGLNL